MNNRILCALLIGLSVNILSSDVSSKLKSIISGDDTATLQMFLEESKVDLRNCSLDVSCFMENILASNKLDQEHLKMLELLLEKGAYTYQVERVVGYQYHDLGKSLLFKDILEKDAKFAQKFQDIYAKHRSCYANNRLTREEVLKRSGWGSLFR